MRMVSAESPCTRAANICCWIEVLRAAGVGEEGGPLHSPDWPVCAALRDVELRAPLPEGEGHGVRAVGGHDGVVLLVVGGVLGVGVVPQVLRVVLQVVPEGGVALLRGAALLLASRLFPESSSWLSRRADASGFWFGISGFVYRLAPCSVYRVCKSTDSLYSLELSHRYSHWCARTRVDTTAFVVPHIPPVSRGSHKVT